MTETIEIRPLATDDAEELTACFRRCYGESYVVAFFYDPAAIRARITDGRLRSLVAIPPDGEIVGHMAMTRPHPGAATVELGNTIVDPRYRRHGLVARLGSGLVEECRVVEAVGYHHYPTTAHAIIQRLAVQAGGVETGVMLGYIPAGTDYRELGGTSAGGRLAVVTVYQPLAAAPARRVYLPQRYAGILRAIYAKAGLEREAIVSPDSPLTAAGSSAVALVQVRSHMDERRALLRVEIERTGNHLAAVLAEFSRLHSPAITQVDLPLSDPGVGRAVEELRAHGFFYCALLPEYAATDVLRMQRLDTRDWILPELVNEDARAILRAALADRAATGNRND